MNVQKYLLILSDLIFLVIQLPYVSVMQNDGSEQTGIRFVDKDQDSDQDEEI